MIEPNLDLWLQQLIQQGIELWVEGEQLRIRAPQGVLTAELRAALSVRKAELVARLQRAHQSSSPLPTLTVTPEERYDPFPLTDIQFAYWVGKEQQELSSGYHGYVEYECKRLDVQRLTQAWQRLIQRHDVLRGIVLPSGQQQILQETPPVVIQVFDLSHHEKHAQEECLYGIRYEMSHQVFALEQWPLFDIRVTCLAADCFRLHVSLALILLDGASINKLFQEWETLYKRPDEELTPLHLSYRDYVVWEKNLATTSLYQQARDYWLSRLDALPPAPPLPRRALSDSGQYRITHRHHYFSKTCWESLRQHAQQAGITPTALLAAVFAEVLAIWSKEARFTLNLTFFNRLPAHVQINEIVGDFTSVNLLAIDIREPRSLLERAQQIHRQLWTDLEHRYFNGVLVLRELARKQNQGLPPLMPIVFTSMLGLNAQIGSTNSINFLDGELIYDISQTPQVLFDHMVEETDGKLIVRWDTADDFFPEGLLSDMFSVYCGRINTLAVDDAAWHIVSSNLLPSYQQAQQKAVNATSAPFPDKTLSELFLQQVKQQPHALAIHAPQVQLTYEQVYAYANQIGYWLRQRGAKPNQLVAVVMEKGWEQIVAVMGILFSGAAYLPIDIELPRERQNDLLEDGQVHLVLTQSQFAGSFTNDQRYKTLCVDSMVLSSEWPALEIIHKPDDLVYVLYTSGSTGKPKGVMIEQLSVVNRMTDVAQRFQLKKQDRVLALTALHHDLSVFDIFAVLTIVGGAVVLPAFERRLEPAHWIEVIKEGNVTLWNSVPAFMQMLIEHLEDSSIDEGDIASLRWVILSGDFIPVTLPDRLRAQIPHVEIISAGGPTETTVWDICYPIGTVDPTWASIPYGQPMRNAQYYVLKDNLEPCPTWVEGELYIAGTGLARGYWRDHQRTNESFIIHPHTGQRLYRSGDMGRYLPAPAHELPNLEIGGRRDFQVKIRGQRIELGEIEATLRKHPNIKAAVVNAIGDPKSPHKQLVAYVVHKTVSQDDPIAAPSACSPVPGQGQALPLHLADSFSAPRWHGDAAHVLTDPVARAEFKLSQRGLRSMGDEQRLRLPPLVESDARRRAYLSRQSYRQYVVDTIPAEQFSNWLGCLAQMSLADSVLPKYLYPSAGGLYPIQTYLYIKSNRITDVVRGYYYYDPAQHELVPLGIDGPDEANLFSEVNQPIFEQAAFALFLVAQLDAISPMYGDLARDFCLLEAGYMSQLLMMQATEQQLGLCPIGEELELDQALRLDESQLLLHTLVGGRIEPVQMSYWLQPTEQSTRPTWKEELRTFLQAKLPPYMVPTHYVELEALPLSANGKVDRQALPVPELDGHARKSIIAPRTPVEEQIADIWRDVLSCQTPSIEQDFFELGGDSLLATRVLARLRQTFAEGVELSLRTLFENPTIAQLGGIIEAQSFKAVDSALLQSVLAELMGEG